jgi:hypothetical protein
MTKINEISYNYNGMDVYIFNVNKKTQQALNLNLIIAKDAPKTLGIFNAHRKEIFLSQNVEDFYRKTMDQTPNLSMFIKGFGKNNTCEKEFDKIEEDDKWMFIKTVAYFGDDSDKNRFEDVLKKSQKIKLSSKNKNEIREKLVEDTDLKRDVNRFLEVERYESTVKPVKNR